MFVPETIFRRSIHPKQTDRTCWTIQTHSDKLNWARRQTFHELNSLNVVPLMKSSTFGLSLAEVWPKQTPVIRCNGVRRSLETLQVSRIFASPEGVCRSRRSSQGSKLSGVDCKRVSKDLMITSIFSSNVHFANSSFLKHNLMHNPDQMFSRCYLCKRFFRPVDGEPLFILSSLTFLHKSSRLLPTSPNPMRFFKLSLKNARSDVTSLKYETHLVTQFTAFCFVCPNCHPIHCSQYGALTFFLRNRTMRHFVTVT